MLQTSYVTYSFERSDHGKLPDSRISKETKAKRNVYVTTI